MNSQKPSDNLSTIEVFELVEKYKKLKLDYIWLEKLYESTVEELEDSGNMNRLFYDDSNLENMLGIPTLFDICGEEFSAIHVGSILCGDGPVKIFKSPFSNRHVLEDELFKEVESVHNEKQKILDERGIAEAQMADMDREELEGGRNVICSEVETEGVMRELGFEPFIKE